MARGSIVKRPSGNYAIVYYVDGKQKWETIGPSRREAERALTARKREVDTGTWREPSSETLAAYAERWLAHRDPARVQGGRTRLAPSTFAEYRRALRHHVAPHSASARSPRCGPRTSTRSSPTLEADGKAPGTVRNVVVPLRKMLGDAVRQGQLVANPAARADLPPAQDFAGKEIPREHTDAIRAALVELAPIDPLRNEPDLFFVCFFDVALGTGLRLGELRALRWRDVDRDRRADPRRARVLPTGAQAAEDRVGSPRRSRSSPRSTPRFASSPPEPSSAAATRRTSSSSRRCAGRRSSRRTSASASGGRRSSTPASTRGLPLPRPAAHLRLAPRRRRRRRQARPGRRRAREPADHAQALLASARLAHQRGRRSLRSRPDSVTPDSSSGPRRSIATPAARRLAGSAADECGAPRRAPSGARVVPFSSPGTRSGPAIVEQGLDVVGAARIGAKRRARS